MDLNLRKKVDKCYICSIALFGAETWDTPKSRSEIPENFLHVVLEKGDDELDRS